MIARPRLASSLLAPVAAVAMSTLLAGCGDDGDASTGGGGGGASSSSSGTASVGATSAAATSNGPSSSSGQGGDPAGTGGGGGSGGDASTGTSSAGGDGGGGVGGAGAGSFPDDCTSPADCPGGECVEIGPGFATCRFPVDEATECTTLQDECCTSDECADSEICVFGAELFCAGPDPAERNRCVPIDDQCLGLDCGKSGAACVPPGVLGFDEAICAPQVCQADADCDSEPGGRCVPVENPCCPGALAGFHCAYPSDGCRDQDDCGDGGYCSPDLDAKRARCVEGFPNCPQ